MTAMDPEVLRGLIRQVLQDFGYAFGPRKPIELLMGTAAQETHLGALGRRQMGGGPALGIYQMEPATYRDCWDRGVKPKARLLNDVLARWPEPNALLMASDDEFATLMARIKYRLVPRGLPDDDNPYACARYYKRWYNTPLGKATIEEYLANYIRFCHKEIADETVPA